MSASHRRTGTPSPFTSAAKGFTQEELVAGGLSNNGQRGPIDRFKGRLLWPIRDITGDVIGFGARRIFDDDRIEAKYVNTPDTPIYKKSTVLYGVDLAKKEIARRMQAVVVEGYTDVMACHLAGIETAIATCGTSFGEDHIRVLRRLLMDQNEFRGEVVFTFDGDSAGQKAAERAFTFDQKFTTQTFVAVEPTGADPCELRQAKGDLAVRDLIANRVPLFEFAIKASIARYDLDTPEGRTGATPAAMAVVQKIRDVSLRTAYARQLSGWLGLPDPDELVMHARGGTNQIGRYARVVAPDDPALRFERDALKVVLQAPHLADASFDGLDRSVFTALPTRRSAMPWPLPAVSRRPRAAARDGWRAWRRRRPMTTYVDWPASSRSSRSRAMRRHSSAGLSRCWPASRSSHSLARSPT